MLNTDNLFTFSQSLKFKTIFLIGLKSKSFSCCCQNIFETMLGSPTRLCRHFFEQQLKRRLAVFGNGFFTAKPLRKTANRLFSCCSKK